MLTPQGHLMLIWNWCFCETLRFVRHVTIMNLTLGVMEILNLLHKVTQ